MKRKAEEHLNKWWGHQNRKPLVIRGARQVGKSTLVRNFCGQNNLQLIEINLERFKRLNKIFETFHTQQILTELESVAEQKIVREGSVLFLDEIQATPAAIAALRYFHEDIPQLPLICAGSLLEFALENYPYPMPVGRIEYYHLGPMNFSEYLLALKEDYLYETFFAKSPPFQIAQTAHEKLTDFYRKFLCVGGMPEAVLAYSETKDFREAERIHRIILQTYEDDFAKYTKSHEISRVQLIFESLQRLVGKKVTYSQISREERAVSLRKAIEILIKARLLIPVYHSDCSGLPLGAGKNQKVFKLFFLDVGLFNHLCGVDWAVLSKLDDIQLINEGVVAEQFAAQNLAYLSNGLEAPELFYWVREEKSQNAEIDFVLGLRGLIVPVEIKSGKSGSLKSLAQFMLHKEKDIAFKFDLGLPSQQEITIKTPSQGVFVQYTYKLCSYPLYLIERFDGILKGGLEK